MSKPMKRPEAWQVRKVAYGLVAVVVAVLGYFGIISEVQADQWISSAYQVIAWVLGFIAPAVAASKTHRGSDSTATDEDVQARPYPPGDLTDPLRDAVHAATARIPGAEQVADAVLTAIRAEERGEHDAAPASPATGPEDAPTTAPGAGSSDLKSVAAYYRGA